MSKYQVFCEQDAVGTYSRLSRGISEFIDVEDIRHRAPQAFAFHARIKSKKVFYMPFHLRGEMIGFTALTFSMNRSVTESARELLGTLSQQLVLCLELMRLAEESQQAAIIKEQQKTASELHDTLAGVFTGIFMQLQAASDLVGVDEMRREACLDRAEHMARKGLQQVRDVVYLLASDGDDVQFSLRHFREAVMVTTSGTATRGSFLVSGQERRLRAAVSHAVLRILQEAVGNAQRYANAQKIEVSLCFEEDRAGR